jgi:hypothetical protein
MPGGAVAPRDGAGDEVLRKMHRAGEVVAEREGGGDGGGVGAAGAVRRDAAHEGGGEEQLRFPIVEDVHGLAQAAQWKRS